ncbi:hypothetical protein [Nodosilinea sp. E11]|uniref:hypothetical protein n=1 Tax=Nodosilinea sp. E11 TaxID=3037479 RepID=UPI002934DD4B|nr:hypothetical protein [Nodosilinea sp. E11]WOD37326.1 hypothetical protein RRF56_02385 [Nodosilinea sp. E11]
MGVKPVTFASRDYLDPLGGGIQGGDRQEESEPGEGADSWNLRFLEFPTVGLVVEKCLLDIRP